MHVSGRRLPAFATIDDLTGHNGIENVAFLGQDRIDMRAVGNGFISPCTRRPPGYWRR